MTSLNILRYSGVFRRINCISQSPLRCTAAIHTCCTVRASKQKGEVEKDVNSFDYMSNMKDFDSIKTFTQAEEEARWKHEPNVIMISLLCLCLHFFILREPNQLDDRLNQPLYDTIPALELIDLGTQVIKLKKEGKDFSKELLRIEELKKIIEEEEAKKKGNKNEEKPVWAE